MGRLEFENNILCEKSDCTHHTPTNTKSIWRCRKDIIIINNRGICISYKKIGDN